MAALTKSALTLYVVEGKALDAIVDNMHAHEKLYKYTKKCSSMLTVIQDLNLAQQHAKAHLCFFWELLIPAINVYFQITFRIPFL